MIVLIGYSTVIALTLCILFVAKISIDDGLVVIAKNIDLKQLFFWSC